MVRPQFGRAILHLILSFPHPGWTSTTPATLLAGETGAAFTPLSGSPIATYRMAGGSAALFWWRLCLRGQTHLLHLTGWPPNRCCDLSWSRPAPADVAPNPLSTRAEQCLGTTTTGSSPTACTTNGVVCVLYRLYSFRMHSCYWTRLNNDHHPLPPPPRTGYPSRRGPPSWYRSCQRVGAVARPRRF